MRDRGGWMYLSLRDHPEVGAALPEHPPTASARAARVSTPVVLLGVTSMLTDVSSEMVATILPLYLTLQVGLSPLAYGFVDGLYQGVTVLVRVAAGLAADRTRRPKLVALFGYSASAVAKLGFLPATSFVEVSAVISVDRAGKGVRTGPRDALIAACSPAAALGSAYGVHRSLDTLGAMCGPLVAFVLLATIPGGYDTVFVTSFSFALLGIAVLLFWVPDLRPARPVRERLKLVTPLVSLLRDSTYRRTLAGAGLLATVTVSDGFLYLVLNHRTDLAPEFFPLLFVGTTLVYFVLAVPVGRLADRIGRRRVFIGGHLALVGAYVAALGSMNAVATSVACLALLGTYYAATDGVLCAITAPMVPETARSTGLAGVQTATAGGRFIAAVLFGLAWTMLGAGTALAVFAAALLTALPLGALLLGSACPASGTSSR